MQALEIPAGVYKRLDGRWCKSCPACGVEQDYLRRNYAIQSFLLAKECKSCSNKKTENCHRGMHGPVRTSWVQKFRIQAELRNIEWSLDAHQIYELYKEQGGVCALSCVPIGWADVGQLHTASIDRVDSSKGYALGNVQLLHKDVNMMKQSFSQSQFLSWCKLIAENFN